MRAGVKSRLYRFVGGIIEHLLAVILIKRTVSVGRNPLPAGGSGAVEIKKSSDGGSKSI